jgi:5-(carboxyamino)imidazole ribonucleotide mutase
MRVISAHRSPKKMVEYASSAKSRGLRVIIAGAGGAAHLPGMVAALTTLPVIGVPVPTKHLGGVDSLHSIVQMPSGVPVATMAIGGARNAGLFALRILALSDADLAQSVDEYQEQLEQFAVTQDAEMQKRPNPA